MVVAVTGIFLIRFPSFFTLFSYRYEFSGTIQVKYMEKWNSNFACRNKMSKFAYLKQNKSEQRCQLLPSRKWLPAAICAIL